jgi:hypothetical protein
MLEEASADFLRILRNSAGNFNVIFSRRIAQNTQKIRRFLMVNLIKKFFYFPGIKPLQVFPRY